MFSKSLDEVGEFMYKFLLRNIFLFYSKMCQNSVIFKYEINSFLKKIIFNGATQACR